MKKLLLLLFLILLSPRILLADVIYEKLGFTDAQGREVVSLGIEGDISANDTSNFVNALNDINQNNHRVQFDSVTLNSPGGEIGAATRIGKLIRGNHLSTWVFANDECLSACSLILQGGVCKMAEGDVGIHRTRSDNDVPLDEVAEDVMYEESYTKQYLEYMGTAPQHIWLYSSIPSWDMRYLRNFEKRDFGLYSATTREMRYRLQIASQKFGLFKSDLLQRIGNRERDLYPDATWDTPDYMYAHPTCSEQLFLEDNMTDHVGINIEPAPEDIFEIYESDRGIEDDEGRLIVTNKIPYKENQAYYFSFRYFAKGETVTYKERVTVNGPTVWGDAETGESYDKSTPNTKISKDRTSATISRVAPNDGYGFGSWMITKEDPKGPVKIEILFKDRVVHTFNYVIEQD